MKKVAVAIPEEYYGPEDRWKVLAIAVVKQAVSDWKEMDKRIKSAKTDTADACRIKRSAEKFLLSDDCELFCGCDGRTILRKMKQGVI